MRRTHSLAVVEPPPDAGHIVRAIRLKLRLTEEELAHALGISFSTVSRWETGHMKPRFFHIRFRVRLHCFAKKTFYRSPL